MLPGAAAEPMWFPCSDRPHQRHLHPFHKRVHPKSFRNNPPVTCSRLAAHPTVLLCSAGPCVTQDAEENLGETEVRDAWHAKATFLGKVGDREAAAAAFKETEDKTASGGSKADMVFSQIRCAPGRAERVRDCGVAVAAGR
jgi:hypothetical protein